VVSERPEKKQLENAGGMGVLRKAGGDNAGLPFLAFLNAKGELIINSKRDGHDNIGYPYQPEEVAWFMTMLGKAATDMTESERQVIENYLRKQKK